MDKIDKKKKRILEIQQEFASRIRMAIAKNDINQSVLADKLGMSKQALNPYIKGESVPSFWALEIIAEVCDVEYVWLVTGKYARDYESDELKKQFEEIRKILLRKDD